MIGLDDISIESQLRVSSQWRHMRVIAPQITGKFESWFNSLFGQRKNTPQLHITDHTKGPVMRFAFSYHKVVMYSLRDEFQTMKTSSADKADVESCIQTRSLQIQTYVTVLTHWGREKFPKNFLTFSNAFSWMKIYKFRFRFNWSLFLRVSLITFQHWFR